MSAMPVMEQAMSQIEIAPDGLPFNIIRLINKQGMVVHFCDWGATWLSCLILVAGEEREVVLGCYSPAQYLQQSAYLGATVGRYANRISAAQIHYQDKVYSLLTNSHHYQLHGGIIGFDKQRWQIVEQQHNKVIFSLFSKEGDQGFPGNLLITAVYELDDDNQLHIDFSATTDKATPVNLTNHVYFNLDGDNREQHNKLDIRNHFLSVNADYYLPVDKNGIPADKLVSVIEDDMDLRKTRKIADRFLISRARQLVGGYDHAYLLNKTGIAAQLIAADKSVTLNVYTTKPALQVYTGNFLAGTPNRVGSTYQNYSGIALETQFLPDSPNHPNWPQPSCWLLPNQLYQHHTIYQFVFDN